MAYFGKPPLKHMKTIEKFSLGMGDRFAHQGRAQLKAVADAAARGITLAPVWNLSLIHI